jgi:acetyl-CoA carboxylase/biotin carboxylase 1
MKLEGYSDMKYTPSRDREWHIYTLNNQDQKSNDQRMFLRTVVRQPSLTNRLLFGSIDNEVGLAQAASSFTSNIIVRSLMTALEEIELHAHNESTRSGHSHMYLCMLREQQLFDLIPFSRLVKIYLRSKQIYCIKCAHRCSLWFVLLIVLGRDVMLVEMRRQHAHF